MQTTYLTPEMRRMIKAIVERDLGLPTLLFFTAHRPLAFVVGQLLYVASPLAGLCGLQQCASWANLLSNQAGINQLEALLMQTSTVPD